MNESASRNRLGRGLAALIGDMDRPVDEQAKPVVADGKAPIELVIANPNNPRRRFNDEELTELAHSIREHGIVQPVVVRPSPSVADHFEIIAGERRWRAAQKAGLANIPVLIREVDDKAALELAIIENVQRADLNAMEEAQGYQQLMDEHGYTQADLGNVIGKSRSHVANTLRLLKLPAAVGEMVTNGDLSAGHARALVNADDPMALARKIVSGNLSVRQAEALAQKGGAEATPRGKSRPVEKDADTLALEKALSDATGLSVKINHSGSGGEMKISYKSLDQLDELCRRLRG
jgi:ParB family chromosome partitioning protein